MIVRPIHDSDIDDNTSDVSSIEHSDYNSDNSNILNNYFDTHHFSINDSSRPYIFTFACHNVRGLMNPSKQIQLLDAFNHKHLDILGLSETKLSSNASIHDFKNTKNFSSWWSHHPSRQVSGGIGLIIRQPLASHVQNVTKWRGRVIYADLYFTSHKFRIINAYVPPISSHGKQERLDTHTYIKKLLQQSLTSNIICILMGDFNVCPKKYDSLISTGLTPPIVEFDLYDFLLHHNFTDNCVFYDHSPLPTYSYTDSCNLITRFSRLDHIWLSPNFPVNDLIHNELWNSDAFYISDHHMLIMYFSSQIISNTIANARLKQKHEKRKIILYQNITPQQWETYQLKIEQFYRSLNSNTSPDINTRWLQFKNILSITAFDTFPIQKVSNTHYQRLPDDLFLLKSRVSIITRILAKYNSYNINHSPNSILESWSLNYRRLISIISHYDLSNLDIPLTVYFPSSLSASDLTEKLIINRRSLINLKKALATRLVLELNKHKQQQIIKFSQNRCEDFSNDTSRFISSSLSRIKRFITMDKILSIDSNNQASLLTDSADIKAAAINHFQNSVPSPSRLSSFYRLDKFSPRWKRRYMPLDTIQDSIYDDLMIPISLDEWTTVLRSMPKDKAAGPSKISYELMQHLGPLAIEQSLQLVNDCLLVGNIPSGWREALLFPIPKPHEWESKLQNTCPITLLETMRKCFVKILNNRLASILSSNHVLQGDNFAGLPGGSCQIPIHTIDTLIKDAVDNKKPLWILSQDISKAFDSIDLNMLKLAMQRLKFPALFIRLILSLFTNRSNQIVTCHGITEQYRVKIGIDQGEVISPLLWVIYLDPLLTELCASAPSPYTYNSTSLSSVYPRKFDEFLYDFTNLTFMDDSTLIASSKEGLESLLTVTEEFYYLNNTSANHSKYVLVSTELLSPTEIIFNLQTSSYNNRSTICLQSLGTKDSFRFLGVWFNLRHNSTFVKTQLNSEYRHFTSLLRFKSLTSKQMAYLHNTVLLPKLTYQSQVTPLSAYSCQKISSPFILMFKQKSKLSSGFPNVGLFSPHLYNLIDLSSFLLRDQISTLYKLLNSRSSIHSLYLARLKSLQSTLWLPISPLDLLDWSPFIKLKCVKNDFLAQTLIAARSLSINFSSSLPSNDSVITGGHLPIIDLIPSIYTTHISSLKSKFLLFLSQLVSADDTYLLSWSELRHLHIVYNRGGHPRWYRALYNLVCSPNSFRLLPQYVVPEHLSIDLLLPLIALNKKCKSAWVAHWSDSSDSIIYGRIIVS